MSVVESLKRKRDFTRAEAELADYILEHAEQVARTSLSDLARATGKSNSTIIRLCRKAGSEGWREFRVDLAAELERDRASISEVDPDAPFSGGAGTATIMSSISALMQDAIDDCYASVDPVAVEALAAAVLRARRVIYFALGDSYATAYAFGALMSKIGVECVAADQYRFQYEATYHAGPEDLALVISYSGDYVQTISGQLERLRAKRCRIGIVTSDAACADRFSGFDCPVLLPLRESMTGKVATFYSQTCIRYVLNCVYSVVFSKNYDDNLYDRDQILLAGADALHVRM